MQSRIFNVLQIPVFFLLLAGAMCLYGYVKFDSLIPVEKDKVSKLQSSLKLLDCKAINKDVILSNGQGKLVSLKDMANVLFAFGLFCVFIGITNFLVVYKYLKRSSDKYGDI